MSLHMTITDREKVLVLDLKGRVDYFSMDELNAGFDRAMDTGKRQFLLIMKDLEYINSRGLGTLISFIKKVRRIGGLVKIAEVPLNIMQLLNILKLDGLALVYESSGDAMESFEGPLSQHLMGGDPSGDSAKRAAAAAGRRNLALLGLSLIVIFLAVYTFVLKEQPKAGLRNSALAPLERRIDGLGQRVSQLEALKREPAPVSGQRMDNLIKEVRQMAGDLEALKKDEGRSSDPEIRSADVPSSTPSKGAPLYHQIRPGDSLSRIGQQYGLSVDRLSAINNIDPKKPIHVGEKLIVGYAGGGAGVESR